MKPFLIIAMSALCISCQYSLFDEIIQIIDDPTAPILIIPGLIEENTIKVQWHADPGATEYILSRSEDIEPPVFTQVYRGINLEYWDKNLISGQRYLYRLVKIRGTKEFPSDPQNYDYVVLGVAKDVRRDAHEPNDTLETAKEIQSTAEANLYYFKANFNQLILEDSDWYSAHLPAAKKLVIHVIQSNLSTVNTYMNINVLGKTHMQIVNDAPIAIGENKSGEDTTVYFRITPDAAQFNSNTANTGGEIIFYSIELHWSDV